MSWNLFGAFAAFQHLSMTFDRRTTVSALMAVLFCSSLVQAGGLSDCMQSFNPRLAIEGCTQLADEQSTSDEQVALAFNNRGNAHAAIGRTDLALEDYSRAIALNPHYAKAYYNRGSTYLEAADFSRAIADFDLAVKLVPDLSDAYSNRGLAHLQSGSLENAVEDFTAAIGLEPGGSLMWVSFWVVAAGWGMGRYAGQVTGVLRPPEHITAQELRWNTNDPQEVAKMQQWVKLGGMSLIIWWAIIGGLLMTYLYSVAGYAYLHDQFLSTGRVPTGVEVPLQMAIVAQGVMGQAAGALMLIVIMVTLYDAQFPFYDTFIGRTTTDAIAVTTKLEQKIPYRVWYFVVVTAAVLAGFYLILQQQPFFMWLMVAVAAVVYRCIGSVQIMMINNRRLPPEFRVSALNTFILWFSFVTGLVAVAYWGYNSWGEIMRRFAA